MRPRFEGIALNALDVTADAQGVSVLCGLMRYRCVVARHHEPLGSIMPLAVSGAVRRRTARGPHVLMGRRSASSMSHAGWHETPPAGGVEISDVQPDGSVGLERRVLEEFRQETGLAGLAPRLQVLGLYRDGPSNTLDVVYDIEIVGNVPPLAPTPEYESLEWISPQRIAAILSSSDRVVPASRWALGAVTKAQEPHITDPEPAVGERPWRA